MPKFIYKAKKGPKELAEGIIEAETRGAAINKLNQMDCFPIAISEVRAIDGKSKTLGLGLFGRIRSRDISIFTRQLSNLLSSGLTLLKALNVLYEQTENRHLGWIIQDIVGVVRDGKPLSEALARHPKVFSPLYISMIRSGELGGMLEGVLDRLADFAEQEEEIRNKVRSALAYPLLMATVGVVTIFVLLTFVIPRLVTMFEEMDQLLPFPTRMLVGISDFLTHYWWLIVAVLSIFAFVIRRRGRTQEGKQAIDRFKLGVPVFGKLMNRVEIARFGRTLGTLLANGIPILQSIGIVAETMDNEVLKKEVERVRKEIREGSTLAKAITKSNRFPIFVTNMIAVGEESGGLEKALFKVADAYEMEVDRAMKIMTSLIEPAMILVMGSIVGFIVIAMLLPIFQINIMAR